MLSEVRDEDAMYQEGFTIVLIITSITSITITSTICNEDTSVGGIRSPLLLGHQPRYSPEPCLVLGKILDKIYKAEA